jgi:dynein heavy chain
MALDKEERRLFADRIRALDRRIMPGVSKLNWVADKHALEFYCKEVRKHCHLADNCVTGFKSGLARIDALCKSIAEGLLIDVEKKKLYETAEFEAVQSRHHHMVRTGCLAYSLCLGGHVLLAQPLVIMSVGRPSLVHADSREMR